MLKWIVLVFVFVGGSGWAAPAASEARWWMCGAEWLNLTDMDARDIYGAVAESMYTQSKISGLPLCERSKLTAKTYLAECGGFSEQAAETLNRRLKLKGIRPDPRLNVQEIQSAAHYMSLDQLYAGVVSDLFKSYCQD